MLRPSTEVATRRALDRVGHPLSDPEPVVRLMAVQFEGLGALEAHAADTGGLTAEASAVLIRDGLAAGRFRALA